MNTKTTIAILTWKSNTGVAFTGRLHRPDGVNWREETKVIDEPKAAVWSSDPKRFAEGREYAQHNGYTFRLLPNTQDVLAKARALEMQSHA